MKIYAGIDVSKQRLDFHFQGKDGQIPNSERAIKRWLDALPEGVTLICESVRTAIAKLPKRIALIAILAASPTLLPAEDLVNEDVPSRMVGTDSTYTLNNGFSKVFTDDVHFGHPTSAYAYSNSRFSIIEGASASSRSLDVGYSSMQNQMIVSGEGSKWESTRVAVGVAGFGNLLTVSNGGYIKTGGVSIGDGSPRFPPGLAPLGDGNGIIVTGSNSVFDAADAIRIGYGYLALTHRSGFNFMRVEDGATLKSGHLAIGQGNYTESCSLKISGEGTVWTNQGTITVGYDGAKHSRLTISDGAKAISGAHSPTDKVTIGYTTSTDAPTNSQILISGAQSSLILKSDLHIGTSLSSTHSTDSFLMLEDGGLLRMGDSTKTNNLVFGGSNSAIYINDGFFAWYGDQVSTLQSLILAGRFRIFNGLSWTTASLDDLFLTYLANSTGEAETLGLYGDLNGYTLISTIPEPSTWVLIVVSVTGFVVATSRRRRKAINSTLLMKSPPSFRRVFGRSE